MTTTEGTQQPPERPAAVFPFQLVDVRLYELAAKRRTEEGDPIAEVPYSVNILRGSEPEDADEFGLLLSFQATVPAGKGIKSDISMSLEGRFKSLVEVNTIKKEVLERFKSLDAIILLWPYLRQHLHDLTSRMRLELPPIPTLDVQAVLAAGEAPSPESAARPT